MIRPVVKIKLESEKRTVFANFYLLSYSPKGRDSKRYQSSLSLQIRYCIFLFAYLRMEQQPGNFHKRSYAFFSNVLKLTFSSFVCLGKKIYRLIRPETEEAWGERTRKKIQKK